MYNKIAKNPAVLLNFSTPTKLADGFGLKSITLTV